jgi:hypothetical protein
MNESHGEHVWTALIRWIALVIITITICAAAYSAYTAGKAIDAGLVEKPYDSGCSYWGRP